MLRLYSRSLSPAGVRETVRRLRLKSCTFSESSNSRMCWLTVDCEIKSAWLARVKLILSATLRNTSSWRKLIGMLQTIIPINHWETYRYSLFSIRLYRRRFPCHIAVKPVNLPLQHFHRVFRLGAQAVGFARKHDKFRRHAEMV